MVLLILLPTTLILLTALSFINVRYKRMALQDAQYIADSYAREYANKIQAELNEDLGIARNMADAFLAVKETSKQPDSLYFSLLDHTLNRNQEYIAVFLQWELSAIRPGYTKPYGRRRLSMYRTENEVKRKDELLNLDGDDTTGIYYKVKKTKKEYVLNPYYYSYTLEKALPSEKPVTEKDVLETTLIVPILQQGKYIGMTGMDIPLDRFRSLIDSIKPFPQSYAFLASNNGKWVAHGDRFLVNTRIADENPEDNQKFQFEQKIQKGETASFLSEYSKTGSKAYVTFAPIYIGKSDSPWSLGIVFPVDIIMANARKHLIFSTVVGIIGFILLFISIIVVSRGITRPIGQATDKLKALSKGAIHEAKLLEVRSGDEVGEMTQSINTLIEALNRIAGFATELGSGKLDADYTLLGDYDILGHTLIGMRDNIKKANEELHKLSIVASRTDTAVVIMDAEGNIEWANQALKQIYGYSLSDVKGNNLEQFSKNKNIRKYLDDCKKYKTSIFYQTYAETKAGTHLWVQTTITPIMENGHIEKLVAIDTDINDLKKAEEEILSQKDRIEQQRDKLEHLNAMKDKFFTIIAHDMKNPFASLLSITQSLSDSIEDLSKEEARFYLKRVFKSAELLHGLLENLLQWATAQTGRMEFNPEPFDIHDTIDDTVQLMKIFADRKNIGLHSSVDDSVLINADKNMITTVIRNLINNAIKYTPEQGRVDVHVSKTEDEAIITVEDNGIGISAEDQEKLFRIDVKTKAIGPSDKEKGTGIGLILCKEFVDRNEGKIWVESTPGKGSRFRFTVKLAG